MKVSDFLQCADEDFYTTVLNKNHRRKRSNLASPSKQCEPQGLLSILLRWFQNPKLATGDGGDCAGRGIKYGCLISFPGSCCKEEEKAEEKEEGDEVAASSKDSLGGYGEKKPEALSFNIGLGTALIFFLAKNATEFNKMAEVRSEMKILLKHAKGEIQRKAVGSRLAESKVDTLPINFWEVESSKNHMWLLDDTESCSFMGRYDTSCNRQSNVDIYLNDRMCLKDKEKEQELHFKLKSLQLNLESHNLSVHPYQQRKEARNQSSENLVETHQKVNQPKAEQPNKHCGVCPRELERRLYELLEARKQEWLEKLATEFKCRESKLHDKDTDTEICWWGETLQGWSQSIEKTSLMCSCKRDAVESASSLNLHLSRLNYMK